MSVKVLGTGCEACDRLAHLTEVSLREIGAPNLGVERVADTQEIRRYLGDAPTPALVVNDEVVLAGIVPSRQTLQRLLHALVYNLDEHLMCCDFAFWSSGFHKIMPAHFFDLYREGKAVLVDLRSDEELQFLTLPFALHIPIHELPRRYTELPRDRLVALFCSGGDRAAVAYAFLRGKGFDNVRIFKGGYAELAAEILPGKLKKRFL